MFQFQFQLTDQFQCKLMKKLASGFKTNEELFNSDRPVPYVVNNPVPYPVVRTVTVDRPVTQYVPQPYPVVKHVPVEVRVNVLVSNFVSLT